MLCFDFSCKARSLFLTIFYIKHFFPAMSCLDVLKGLFGMYVFLMCFCYRGFFLGMPNPVVMCIEFIPLRLFV